MNILILCLLSAAVIIVVLALVYTFFWSTLKYLLECSLCSPVTGWPG